MAARRRKELKRKAYLNAATEKKKKKEWNCDSKAAKVSTKGKVCHRVI